MPLSAVFLDVGNTLLSEEPSRYEIYAEAARRRGKDVGADEMHALMGRAHRALPREIDGAYRYSDPWFAAFIRRVFGAELGLGRAEVAAIEAELFARFEDARTFRLFPGARELLRDLRARDLVVGVVSNWSARLPRVMEALGLAGSLDFVLSSAEARAEKPDPAIFRAALARAGDPDPRACLHAGDTPERDVEGARAAGIQAVLVDHHGALSAAAAPGTPRVRGLGELRSLILERLA